MEELVQGASMQIAQAKQAHINLSQDFIVTISTVARDLGHSIVVDQLPQIRLQALTTAIAQGKPPGNLVAMNETGQGAAFKALDDVIEGASSAFQTLFDEVAVSRPQWPTLSSKTPDATLPAVLALGIVRRELAASREKTKLVQAYRDIEDLLTTACTTTVTFNQHLDTTDRNTQRPTRSDGMPVIKAGFQSRSTELTSRWDNNKATHGLTVQQLLDTIDEFAKAAFRHAKLPRNALTKPTEDDDRA
jgi:hypothetical protein